MGAVFVTFIAAVAEIPDARHLLMPVYRPAVFEGSDGTGKTAQLGLHQGRRTEQQRGAHFMVHQDMEKEGTPVLSNFLHLPLFILPSLPSP